MTAEDQVESLASALAAQASNLAREHLAAAEEGRRRILDEAREKVRLIEEREVLAAKSEAERLHRQGIQAEVLRLAAEADRMRWALVESVIDAVHKRLRELANDEASYEPVLHRLVLEAVASIETEDIELRLNARDAAHYAGEVSVSTWARETGKNLRLSPLPHQLSGGVIATSVDGRIRMDNTFEGRLTRLHTDLVRVISEQLFATVPDMHTWLAV